MRVRMAVPPPVKPAQRIAPRWVVVARVVTAALLRWTIPGILKGLRYDCRRFSFVVRTPTHYRSGSVWIIWLGRRPVRDSRPVRHGGGLARRGGASALARRIGADRARRRRPASCLPKRRRRNRLAAPLPGAVQGGRRAGRDTFLPQRKVG